MQAGQQQRIYTNPLVDFREALTHGGGIGSNSAVVNMGLDLAVKYSCVVRTITISSVQNIQWEVWWFATAAGAAAATPAQSTFLGRWLMDTGAGEQLGAAGPYEYVVSGLDMFFQDLDSANNADVKPSMHLVLVNKDNATDKLADDAGMVKVTVLLEAMAERF